MSLVVIDCSREARSPWTARLSSPPDQRLCWEPSWDPRTATHCCRTGNPRTPATDRQGQEYYKGRLTPGAAQPGSERGGSSLFMRAVTTNCICLMIKCFAVENREPLMLKLKRSLDGVSECVCVRVLVYVVYVQAWGIFWRRRCEICPGWNPCFSSQIISLRLWNLPLTVCVIDRMRWSDLLPTYEKAL